MENDVKTITITATEDEARWLLSILSRANSDLGRTVKQIAEIAYDGDIGDCLRAQAECSDAIVAWEQKVRAELPNGGWPQAGDEEV